MKLTKYILVACLGLSVAACSDDTKWNTDSNVTVEMAQASVKVMENRDVFYVPLKVTGKTNGPISVTVDVAEAAVNPAVENVNYYVTSKTVVIPDNETEVKIEFTTVNDKEINEDREFTVTIAKVEGAKLGEVVATVVTLRDDDGIPYEAIQGVWDLNGMDLFDNVPTSQKITIYGIEDDQDPAYGKVLYFSGFAGSQDLKIEVSFSYVEAEQKGYINIPLGQVMGIYNKTYECQFWMVSGQYVYPDGVISATVNSDLNEITFDLDPDAGFYIPAFKDGQNLGGLDGMYSISMSR
ncbi:MAG: hypothetical protein K2M00_09015 [Muribaculaceae bacterium]|nr:hypothetical protein [Muribaculaceae bacterium]